MDLYFFFFLWFWWAPSHPMGPFESQEGTTKCWNQLRGLLLYSMSSVRGFTEDIWLNSIREQEICCGVHKWTMVNFFLFCRHPEPCKWCKMYHLVGFRTIVSTTECCSSFCMPSEGNPTLDPRETEYYQTPIKLGCGSFIVSDLLSFFVLGWFSKSPWTDCSGFRSPVCSSGRLTPDWGAGATGGVRLPANRSVTTPLYEGLREVGNGTRVALALILKLSLAQRKLQAPIVTSWLHRFILMRETVLILQPSWAMTKLPGLTCMRAVVNWASVACLANSRTPADFFCFVFFSYYINWAAWNL